MSQSIKPSDFASYLAEPGQSMNATYTKAIQERNQQKQRTGSRPTTSDVKRERPIRGGVKDGSSANTLPTTLAPVSSSKLIKSQVEGPRKIMSKILEIPDGRYEIMRFRWVRNANGRRVMQPDALLPSRSLKHANNTGASFEEASQRPRSKRIARRRAAG
jgi:hypothetical protein